MKKMFGNCLIEEITAIAICDEEREDHRQKCLLVTDMGCEELAEMIAFGYEMPEDAEEFDNMCLDSWAWENASTEHHIKRL